MAERTLTYRRLAVLLPALLSSFVLLGMLLIMLSPGFITKSPAFNAGGYLQSYSGQGYLQFVLSLLGIVTGASFAAFLVGIRSIWFPYAVVRARRISFVVVNWLAAITVVCFILSLFLLTLPVSEVGAFALLTTLSVSFALVGHFSRWASGLPEELVLAMESDVPLYELQTIDLDTSARGPMLESDAVIVAPPGGSGRMAQATSLGPGRLDDSSGDALSIAAVTRGPRFRLSRAAWEDLALATIPAFFGLMGLSQLKEGRRSRGISFLIAGLALGALSSWFLILPSRIGEFFSSQPMPAVATLSWLSSSFGGSTASSWVIGSLLVAFLLVWVLQLTDAIRHINPSLDMKVERTALPS